MYFMPISFIPSPSFGREKKSRKRREYIYIPVASSFLAFIPAAAKVPESRSFALHFPSLCRQSCSCNGTRERTWLSLDPSFACLSLYSGLRLLSPTHIFYIYPPAPSSRSSANQPLLISVRQQVFCCIFPAFFSSSISMTLSFPTSLTHAHMHFSRLQLFPTRLIAGKYPISHMEVFTFVSWEERKC